MERYFSKGSETLMIKFYGTSGSDRLNRVRMISFLTEHFDEGVGRRSNTRTDHCHVLRILARKEIRRERVSCEHQGKHRARGDSHREIGRTIHTHTHRRTVHIYVCRDARNYHAQNRGKVQYDRGISVTHKDISMC